jgi:hypothetical protein
MWRTENGETARDRLKGTKLIYHYDSGLPHPFPSPYALKAVTRNIQANVYTRHKSYTNIETERTKRQKKRENWEARGGCQAVIGDLLRCSRIWENKEEKQEGKSVEKKKLQKFTCILGKRMTKNKKCFVFFDSLLLVRANLSSNSNGG